MATVMTSVKDVVRDASVLSEPATMATVMMSVKDVVSEPGHPTMTTANFDCPASMTSRRQQRIRLLVGISFSRRNFSLTSCSLLKLKLKL